MHAWAAHRNAVVVALFLAVTVAAGACGSPSDGPRPLVREQVDAAEPTTTTPSSEVATPEASAAAETADSAPPPPPPVTAAPPVARATPPPVRPGGRAPTAAPAPVVKQPPPRPNRASEAPTQPAGSSEADLTPAGPTKPPTTARYPQDFPDPFVFRAGSFWYALSTQRGMSEVPLIRSPDLVHWEERGDALASVPRWSRFGAVWAPSVLPVPTGFVLYYTTPHAETGLQCVSRAFSALPDGPYVDVSSGPFVCQTDRGGSIDPSPFRDHDGKPWLTWKSEGTLDGEPTRIWSQRLSDDGRSLVGDPTELLRTEAAWEGPIIEGPSMLAVGGRYHLFYSGNRWETDAYGTGHASCAGPAGPCVRTARTPVLRPHSSEAGTGGGEVFVDLDGSLKFAYHAWDPTKVGYPAGLRRLRIGAVRLSEAGAAIVEPLEV